MKFHEVSIIVPTLNEEHNVALLAKRVDATLSGSDIRYEILFIDDFSTDKTREVINSLTRKYPVSLHLKKGQRGKAQSILEGFEYAKYSLIAMIDADLQYPPEAIVSMVNKINEGTDVVVSNRHEEKISFRRRIISKSFVILFGKFLHNLNCDVQSGLKVFKREIIERIKLNPSPWTFDMEFLLQARHGGYIIDTVDIIFEKRHSGKSKVGLLQTSFEIGLNALKLKFAPQEIIPFHPDVMREKGVGFHYKGKEFIDYTQLYYQESAFHGLSFQQKFVLFILAAWFIIGLILNFHITLIVAISLISLLYFSDLVFNLFLIYRSFVRKPEIHITDTELKDQQGRDWPIYTVFCPLYKEWRVVPQFINAMSALDYPKDKLQILLLLEEDDKETVEKVQELELPQYFQVIVIPHSQPKTKPKALNYGLLHARGDFVAIYDAEDIPEQAQLKKAVLAFEKVSNKTICIQAKLNFYNPRQNILTRLFTAEYSLWFDLVLTGLQSINAPIPLGGTSNHFKLDDLYKLQGWDPFNVTEDCDLGMRLAKYGYETAIIDSTTFEEANSSFRNWIPQRTRWNKGYIQTLLVHTRNIEEIWSDWKKPKLFVFMLVVGGKIFSMFINPFMWLTTIIYFTFRQTLGPTIESFFPPAIFYIAVFSLVVGNFLYFYYYMIGLAKRGYYDLIKYAYLIPIYWLGMSLAAWRAVIEIFYKPHYWAKTVHGLHLSKRESIEKIDDVKDVIDNTDVPAYPIKLQSMSQ